MFAHNCTTAPCTVTQIHIPSIYPGGGCPWDWQDGILRVYIDGSTVPTIDITLLQMASVSAAASIGNDAPHDVSPFGARLFGKNAKSGGVWSTVRIPFGTSIRVTLTAAISCGSQSALCTLGYCQGACNSPFNPPLPFDLCRHLLVHYSRRRGSPNLAL